MLCPTLFPAAAAAADAAAAAAAAAVACMQTSDKFHCRYGRVTFLMPVAAACCRLMLGAATGRRVQSSCVATTHRANALHLETDQRGEQASEAVVAACLLPA